MKLTQQMVATRVAGIARVSHDDALARTHERRLWESVLVAAAEGEDSHVATLAQTALATRNHVFEEVPEL